MIPRKFIADSSRTGYDVDMHAHPCALRKGKSVVRRSARPTGLRLQEEFA
jgi:hypothetical protein